MGGDNLNDDEIIGMFWQRNQKAINAVSEKYGKLCGSVAFNILKNHRKKRGALTHIEEEAEEIFISEDTAQNEAERKELAEAINGFLGECTAKKRMIFMKRYWLMDSIKDIAAAFDMAENSVSVSLMRTRKELKAYLEKRGFDVE